MKLEVLIRTMYSIVKSGKPVSQFHTLCELHTLNSTLGFEDSNRLYTSHCSFAESNQWNCRRKVNHILQASPFVGLVTDESTDVAVYKKLVIYVCIVILVQPFIHFVSDMNAIDDV